MPEPYGVDTSGNFVPGATYIILTEGTTDWNYVAGTGHAAFPPVPDIIYKVDDVITCVNPDSGDSSGTGTARRVELAGSLNAGSTYIIVRLGTTTNWNTLAGTSGVVYKEGDVFTAANAGSGNGIVSRVAADLGRIGGKALKDNLEREGVDLAFRNTFVDDPVLYLKVSPNVTKIVGAQSLQAERWYKVRSLNGTDWREIGAPTNTVGTIFRATGPSTPTNLSLQLVLNGTFDTDVLDWDTVGSGSLNWIAARQTMQIDASGAVLQIVQQEIDVTVGKPYNFQATHVLGGIDSPTTDFTVEVADSTFVNTYISLTKSDLAALGIPGTINLSFTPLTSSIVVKFTAFNCQPEWDDISVREIVPSLGTVYEIEDDTDPTSPDVLRQGLGTGIGINTEIPFYDVDVNSEIKTTIQQASQDATFDNIIVTADGYFRTKVGPIHIMPSGGSGVIQFERISTDDIAITDNYIEGLNSNQSIELRPHGTGTVELEANTNIEGKLSVLGGDINLVGDLTYFSNIILGDSSYATVDFNTDFKQDILPGRDNQFDLGQDKRDSTPRFWGALYSPDLTNVEKFNATTVTISDQLKLDGLNNEIVSLQSNDDVLILPQTGVSYIEGIRFNGSVLTNLIDTPSLNAAAIAASIAGAISGDSAANEIWTQPLTGTLRALADGSTIQFVRTAQAGDIYDDSSTLAGVINADDIATILNVDDSTVPNLIQEELWYQAVIKPYIFNDPDLYKLFGNGASIDSTPLTISSTGSGFVRFNDSFGIVIPAGSSQQREYSEIGDTRWNTELQYLECFDGSVYTVATGGGEEVNVDLMEELAIQRALTFG